MPNIIAACGANGRQSVCVAGKGNTGGVTGTLLAIPSTSITAITQVAVAGTTQNSYSAFTLTVGAQFKKWDIDKLSGFWSEEYQPNNNGTGGSWLAKVGFKMAGENQAITNFINSLATCCSDWTFLITDNNGNTKVFTTAISDYAGGSMKLFKVVEGTGVALNDYNGSDIEFNGIMPLKSNFFSGTVASLPQGY